jgi:hypothetical protein
MARYVVRLSMALGDLRIAAQYATRRRQNAAERLYFVRLTASHLRELVLVMDPPNAHVVPRVDEFLDSLPRGTKPSRTEIRRSHARALRMLDRPMSRGRPELTTVNGKRRRPTLRDDLKELRNRFFHYGHDQAGDDALWAAMASVDGEATGYMIRERTLRAMYADDIGTKLAHPFDVAFADDMHRRVVALLGPASLFVQQVEAAWLHAHRGDVLVRRPGLPPRTLADILAG